MFKIAIVGAGPAGVSAASRLLKATANKESGSKTHLNFFKLFLEFFFVQNV